MTKVATVFADQEDDPLLPDPGTGGGGITWAPGDAPDFTDGWLTDDFQDDQYDWVSGGMESDGPIGSLATGDGESAALPPDPGDGGNTLEPVTVTGSPPAYSYLPSDLPYQDTTFDPLDPTGPTPGEGDQMLGFFPVPPYKDTTFEPMDPTGLPDFPDIPPFKNPFGGVQDDPRYKPPTSPYIPNQELPNTDNSMNPGTGGPQPKPPKDTGSGTSNALLAPTFSKDWQSLDASVIEQQRKMLNGRSSTILTGGQGENEAKLQTSSILLGR